MEGRCRKRKQFRKQHNKREISAVTNNVKVVFSLFSPVHNSLLSSIVHVKVRRRGPVYYHRAKVSYSASQFVQGFGAFYVLTISVIKPVAFVLFRKVIHLVFSYSIPSSA